MIIFNRILHTNYKKTLNKYVKKAKHFKDLVCTVQFNFFYFEAFTVNYLNNIPKQNNQKYEVKIIIKNVIQKKIIRKLIPSQLKVLIIVC